MLRGAGVGSRGGEGLGAALIMYVDAFEEVSRTVGDVAPRLER